MNSYENLLKTMTEKLASLQQNLFSVKVRGRLGNAGEIKSVLLKKDTKELVKKSYYGKVTRSDGYLL